MMKTIMFLMFFTSSMTTSPPNLGEIAKSISSGNAAELANFFAEDVELTLLGDTNLYTKEEAQTAVADFFTANKPKKYTQVHEGSSKGANGQYCIGILETGAQKYRVMLYMEKAGGEKQFLIKEIKFEKE